MLKKFISLLAVTILFTVLFALPAAAIGIRSYGEGNNNFHKDVFRVQKDDNGDPDGIRKVDSNGFYNGWADPDDEDNDFKVWYKMWFTEKDKQRINKGDLSVKVTMKVAKCADTWWANDDAIFGLFAWVDSKDDWVKLDGKTAEVFSATTWTFEKNIPVGSSALELDFSSDEDGDNDVEFNTIRVYFYDKNAPTVKEIKTTDSGVKKIGSTVTFQVVFDEAVNVAGKPKIKMNTGDNAYAYYKSGSGTDTLTFTYTVTDGEQADKLNIAGNLEYDSGASIKDDGSNATATTLLGKTNNLLSKNIKVDGKKPEIKSIVATGIDRRGKTPKQLNADDTVEITVNFSEPVTVTGTAGTIKLPLNNGGYAICQGTGSGVSSLKFNYTVPANGQDVGTLNINGDLIGGTIVDSSGNSLLRSTKSITSAGIRIDNTAAKATFSVKSNTKYSQDQSTKVTITDTGGSGLTGLTYKYTWSTESNIDHINWSGASVSSTSATTAQTLKKSDVTGLYYLHVCTEDIAGNYGYYQAGPFHLDNQGPVITLDKSGSATPGGDYSVKATVKDALTSVNTSALRYQWYREVIGSNWRTFSLTNGTGTITAIGNGIDNHIDSHGNWKLAIEASDSAGNKTTITSGNFLIDKVAPEITISPNTSESMQYKRSHAASFTYFDSNKGYTPGGIAYKAYQWTDTATTPSNNWQNYNGNVVQGTYNGSKYFHVMVRDTAGNVATQYQQFLYDNTAPAITFNNNGSETVQGAVTASITFSDAHSAINDWFYEWTQDGNPTGSWRATNSYSIPLTDADGDWYLSVMVRDNAGNSAVSTSRRFRMDNMPPVGGMAIQQDVTNSNRVSINLEATDTNYPDQIQYRMSVDGGNTWGEWKTYIPHLDNVALPDVEGLRKVQVQFRDKFFNESNIYEDTVILDKTPPSAEISYSCSDWTSSDVVATLHNINDTFGDGEGFVERDSKEVTLVNQNEMIFYDAMNHTYSSTFQNNSSVDFILRDKAGNEALYTADVRWIDKTNPQITFSSNGNNDPSKAATVTVTAKDTVWLDNVVLKDLPPEKFFYQWTEDAESPLVGEAGWIEASNGDTIHLDGLDGIWYLHVKVADSVGNETLRTTNQFVLDNTPPKATVTFSNTDRTASPVTAYIAFDEYATIINPADGSNHHVFDNNGEFTFTYQDAAGNVGDSTVQVNWIDKSLPSAAVKYSTRNWTNENVTVTVSVYGDTHTELLDFRFPESLEYTYVSAQFSEDLTVAQAVYEIANNGSFEFTVKDLDTDKFDTVRAVIKNIDKEPPTGQVIYSETKATQNNIQVTLLTADNTNQKVTVIPPAEAVIEYVGGNPRYIFTENGSYAFTIRDMAGNETVVPAEISNIDRVPPEVELAYSQTEWTYENVTAILIPETGSINLNTETVAVERDGSTQYQYTFYENGTFTFRVSDAAGNITEKIAEVNWIDKEAPDGSLITNTISRTNQDVEVTIVTWDNSKEPVHVSYPEKVEKVEIDGKVQYHIADNGTYFFTLSDAAGNEKTVTVTVNNIDRIIPTAEISYSNTAITNGNVEIRLNLSEEADVEHPEGITKKVKDGNTIYEVQENGEYLFTLTDKAGNIGTATATIANIDKQAPVGYVEYSTTEPTNGYVRVTVKANEEFVVSNNFNLKQRDFSENGSYTFIIMDLAGNISQVRTQVINIDKTPPNVSIEYSTKDLTNGNVTATVISDEPIQVLNNNGKSSFEFSENGVLRFVVSDYLGNTTNIYAQVDNIDKIAPVITLEESEPIILAVAVEPSSSEELLTKIKDELNKTSAYDNMDGNLSDSVVYSLDQLNVNKPGQYDIQYSVSDRAGNSAEAVRRVVITDRETFNVFVNGQLPSIEPILINTAHIKFTVVNPKGELEVRWKEGYWSEGSMKSMANVLEIEAEGYIFHAEKEGFYTFYLQDQERNSAFVQIFIQAVDQEEVE